MLKISPEDRARVSAAVHEAEKRTSGEIVTIAAARSDTYLDVVLGWGLAVIFIVLATLASLPASWIDTGRAVTLGWQARIDHHEVILALIALLAVKVIVASWLVALWPVRMALTPRRIKARRARARALDYFRVGAERRTAGRTAVLIYLSIAERQVEIVADRGIHSRVPPESWGGIAAGLVEALRDGRPGDGLADAVTKTGELLALHFPPSDDNPNELPDRLIEVGEP